MPAILPRIIVEFVWPPIPDRRFDFLAYYQGEDDEMFDKGWGRTREEAVVDLIENYPRGEQCTKDRPYLEALSRDAERAKICVDGWIEWQRQEAA